MIISQLVMIFEKYFLMKKIILAQNSCVNRQKMMKKEGMAKKFLFIGTSSLIEIRKRFKLTKKEVECYS